MLAALVGAVRLVMSVMEADIECSCMCLIGETYWLISDGSIGTSKIGRCPKYFWCWYPSESAMALLKIRVSDLMYHKEENQVNA